MAKSTTPQSARRAAAELDDLETETDTDVELDEQEVEEPDANTDDDDDFLPGFTIGSPSKKVARDPGDRRAKLLEAIEKQRVRARYRLAHGTVQPVKVIDRKGEVAIKKAGEWYKFIGDGEGWELLVRYGQKALNTPGTDRELAVKGLMEMNAVLKALDGVERAVRAGKFDDQIAKIAPGSGKAKGKASASLKDKLNIQT